MTPGREEELAERVDDALRRLWDGTPGALDELLGPLPERARSDGSSTETDPFDQIARAIPAGPTLVPGSILGDYRIVRRIGRGGMGIVYEAEQASPRRRVALKVLQPTDDDDRAALLLDREVQALARLRHPGIATLFEADRHGNGTRYFVMELVDGRPFDQHCIAAALGTRDRVRLVVDLCDAIVYAHERGVIHRDLKPANVLVEATGRVRVLDFGLARLAHQEGEASLPSIHAAQAGTPEYMSPEQVSAAALEVDVRTDVYSLGVLTYQALLGRLPYTVPRISPLASARAIAEAEPQRPRGIDRRFPRDLEAIVMKALEKDPDRRYANVRELADDLRRFLDDRPVEARELTPFYLACKFARRRKGLVFAATISTAAVLAGIVALNVGLLRARAAEHAARDEAAVAQSVSRFQEFLFSNANPDLADRPGLTVRELLAWASPQVGTMFSESARAEAEVRTLLGRALNSMSAFDEALPHLERAALLRRQLGDDILLARSLRNLAFLLHGLERFERSERVHEEALALRRARLGDRHEETVQSRIELAALLRDTGRLDEAILHLRAAYDACAGDGLGPVQRLAEVLLDWSTCEALQGRTEAALVPLREGWSRAVGEACPLELQITACCRRTTLLARLRQLEQANRELDRAILLAEASSGLDDRRRITIHREVGEALLRFNRAEQAVPHLEHAARLLEERFGPQDALSRRQNSNLGDALSRIGERDRAFALLSATLTWQEETFGPGSREASRTRLALGEHLSRHDDPEGAVAALTPCTTPTDDHPMSTDIAFRACIEIAKVHLIGREYELALQALATARQGLPLPHDPDGEKRLLLGAGFAWALFAAGRPDAARHELITARAAADPRAVIGPSGLQLRTLEALVADALEESDADVQLGAALAEIEAAPWFSADLGARVRATIADRAGGAP